MGARRIKAGTMATPIFVFADLDDSLFQTLRKCPQGTDLTTAAVDRQGAPLSYTTPQQRALLTLLERAVIIPVTGRNTAALERVHMAFSSYRITSHGALVMTADGYADASWLARIEAPHRQWIAHMEAASAWVERARIVAGLALRCRIIEDQGMPVYVSIKGEEAALERLSATIHEAWGEEEARVHRNGENMALLPPFARKEEAVAFLMQRLWETEDQPLFIGLGDSATDLPFMRLCHYAMAPQQSQIRAMLWK